MTEWSAGARQTKHKLEAQVAALSRDNKRMAAQLQLAGIGVDTHGALLDTAKSLAARAVDAENALSSLKRDVLEINTLGELIELQQRLSREHAGLDGG